MPGSITSDDGEEWSCGTCTFLNKPLFLSCEMCGQARPSQRPSPPRRQPSPSPADHGGDRHRCDDQSRASGGTSSTFHRLDDLSGANDRAPRSVQRHRSTVDIRGTLIMTDDPEDYERQDGKKPGEESDDEDDLGLDRDASHNRRRTREEDPTLDESMERHMMEPMHAPHDHHRRDSHSRERFHERPQNYRRARTVADPHYTNEPPRRRPSREGRRESYSTTSSPSYHHQQLLSQHPSTRKPSHNGSNQTLPTQYMSGSSRMGIDDSPDDVSDISGLSGSLSLQSSRHYPHHHQHQHQQHQHHQHHSQPQYPREYGKHPREREAADYYNGSVSGNSRRHLSERDQYDRDRMSSRNLGGHHHHQQQHQHQHYESSAPRHHHERERESHYPQRNGLPVVSNSSRQLMQDHSYGSHGHYSTQSPAGVPRGTRRPTLGSQSHHLMQQQQQHHSLRRIPSNQAMSMRSLQAGTHYQQQQAPPQHHHHQQQHYYPDARSTCSATSSMRRGASAAALSNSNADADYHGDSFLPPITPPPVPTMDMPTDVNVMEVFVKDHQAAERRATYNGYGSSDHPGDRRRSAQTVRKDRASMLDNLSRNNNFTSNRSLAGSSVRGGGFHQHQETSNRNFASASSRQFGIDEECSASGHYTPGEMLDSEALDSPNTRRERRKERRKMKGAVRTLMATMRISNK